MALTAPFFVIFVLHFDITGDNSNFIRKLHECENGVRNTSKQIEQSGLSIEDLFNRMTKAAAAFGAGFTAKEAIVSTMGVLANVSGDTEDAVTVAQGVASWFPSTIAAFTFLMFNLLDSPCLAAIATMAQQMQSRKWFWFAILFQNIFAYIVCLCVYQIGSFVTGGAFGVGTAVGFLFLIAILFMLFRPDPYKNQKVYSKRSVNA